MIRPGQVVICINAGKLRPRNIPPTLKEGNKYFINQTDKCTCGRIKVDVGISRPSNDRPTTACGCGKLYYHNGIRWCDSVRFAPISVNQEHVEAIEKIKQEEVFEN